MVRGVVISGSPVALYTRANFPRAAVFRPSNDNGGARTGNTVTVRRQLDKSGVAVKVKVPVDEFYGVAVSTSISEDGELMSAIELVHADPDLNYRVFEELGNTSVVAEWQNWGKKLRLPLYIRAGDGALIPYSQHVDGVLVGRQTGRRMLAPEAERRTRFARRRKTGTELN